MIYAKLVAMCDTGGCETTQEYVVEISNFETEEGFYTDMLPDDWQWVFDLPGPRGLYRRAICPHCAKERKK